VGRTAGDVHATSAGDRVQRLSVPYGAVCDTHALVSAPHPPTEDLPTKDLPTEDLEGSDLPATEPPRRHDQPGASGSAGVRRVTAAALGELADHRAEAVADLDRALAARIGDLDRAI
jgi:hypothetical protein